MRLLKAISLASAAIIMIGGVQAKDLIAPTNQLTILHINDHHSHLRADGRMSLNIGGEKTRVRSGGFPAIVSTFDNYISNSFKIAFNILYLRIRCNRVIQFLLCK